MKDYYKQLTSEFRTTVIKRGRSVSVWDKKDGDRNEALDVMAYNLAAAHLLGIGFWTRKDWEARRRKFNVIEGIAAEVKEGTINSKVEEKEIEQAKPRRIKRLPRRIKGNSSFSI